MSSAKKRARKSAVKGETKEVTLRLQMRPGWKGYARDDPDEKLDLAKLQKAFAGK